MQLKVIDFNARFMQDYMQWCQEQEGQEEAQEQMEDQFYELYESWMESPKQWLEGKSPEQYFQEIGDPQMYVSAVIEYVLEEVELPDPLLHCLEEQKKEIYPILLGILNAQKPEDFQLTAEQLLEVQGHAVSLIQQLNLQHPYAQYLKILRELTEECLFAEEATQALAQAGKHSKTKYMRHMLRRRDMQKSACWI